jgi:hypothetical protein
VIALRTSGFIPRVVGEYGKNTT